MTHGFVTHWKNLVPSGLPWPVYILLIPIEIMGMFVKPFALTMRLAANMTGGHIAILSILSLVFIFNQVFNSAALGMGVGVAVALPLAVFAVAKFGLRRPPRHQSFVPAAKKVD